MSHLQLDPGATAALFLAADARAALAAQGAATPEARPWLALLEVALTEADREVWRRARIGFPAGRAATAPLLDGAHVRVGAAAASRLLDALRLVVQREREARRPPAPAVIGAAIAQDHAQLTALALACDETAEAFSTVAYFAALPLLLEAGRRAAALVPTDWQAGCCPVCGAWPTLAELRGLERRRLLRCGRCAAAWPRDVLRCTFCDERDHRRQGALVPAEDGEFVRVETCDACGGYLKVFTTLRAKEVWTLHLDDLRTLPLELRALERGYARPAAGGRAVRVDIAVEPE